MARQTLPKPRPQVEVGRVPDRYAAVAVVQLLCNLQGVADAEFVEVWNPASGRAYAISVRHRLTKAEAVRLAAFVEGVAAGVRFYA